VHAPPPERTLPRVAGHVAERIRRSPLGRISFTRAAAVAPFSHDAICCYPAQSPAGRGHFAAAGDCEIAAASLPLPSPTVVAGSLRPRLHTPPSCCGRQHSQGGARGLQTPGLPIFAIFATRGGWAGTTSLPIFATPDWRTDEAEASEARSRDVGRGGGEEQAHAASRRNWRNQGTRRVETLRACPTARACARRSGVLVMRRRRRKIAWAGDRDEAARRVEKLAAERPGLAPSHPRCGIRRPREF
jgi:hypothetical protein